MFGPEPEPTEVLVARYQASEEARRIVSEACEEADRIRAEAYRTGHESGREQGYAAGAAAARTDLDAQFERLRIEYRAEFAQLIARLAEETRDQWLNAEPHILALVMDIARKVVSDAHGINPILVVEVVKNALRRVVDGENVRVRVNAADLEALRAARADILTVIDTVRNVEIIEDRRISQGGCVVETSSGTIDAKLETQFRTIEESLYDVREEVVAELRADQAKGA